MSQMIHIDIQIPAAIIGLPQAIVKSLPPLARQLQQDIRNESRKVLKSTREDYKESLKLASFPVTPRLIARSSVKFAVISLNGFLANAVESGWGGGNMVGWLVKGSSGNGQYATIRFRHTQQGTSGASGTPMGSMEAGLGGMGQKKARMVGKAIARAATKTLTENAKAPKMGSPQHQARMSANTAAQAGSLIMRGRAKGAKRHSSSVYTGMSKRTDTGGSNQSSYETYRRASVRVQGKWIHPGIAPHDFFGKALQRFPRHVKRAIHHTIEGMKGT